VSDTGYEKKIERGLILWLREIKDIKATEAQLSAEGEEESYGYCDTCYGTSAAAVIYVAYKAEGDQHWSEVEVERNSLDFLPELLPYIDRAN
jgi:hypothetical protein